MFELLFYNLSPYGFIGLVCIGKALPFLNSPVGHVLILSKGTNYTNFLLIYQVVLIACLGAVEMLLA